jgi:outer membrane protein insertion porin family
MRAACVLLLLLLPMDLWADDHAAQFEPFKSRPITRITISGNKTTKEYVIRREIVARVGELLDPSALHESIVNLENLDIFSSVEVQPTDDGDGVALEVVVREMPWLIPYIKFKYADETGWSVGPTVSALNFLGRDISLSAYVLFGGTETGALDATYPWIAGNHLSFDLTVKDLTRDDELNEFREHSYELTPWVGVYLGKHGRLKGTISWFQMHSDSTGRTLVSDGGDNLVSVRGSIGYDTRDSWADPHEGWQNELEIGKTGGGLPGDGDSWRLIFDVRRFQPIADGQTLSISGLTSLNTGTVGVEYPSYLMYRMGGANSIRGYNVEELGKTVFGQNQIILSLEYQMLIMPFKEYLVWKWAFRVALQAAAFADWGTAWNQSASIRDPAKAGIGIGLRPLLPGVGMLRLDFAMGEGGDFIFNFGISRKFDSQRERIR